MFIKKLILCILLLCFFENLSYLSTEDRVQLNRPNFFYRAQFPPLPLQSKNYLNIANYNIKNCFKDDKDSKDSWENRKSFYIATIQSDDEARQLITCMRDEIKASLTKYLTPASNSHDCKREKGCITCGYNKNNPFPVLETEYFQISLKASYNDEGVLFGNFPYPYRLVIALKRHSSLPSEEEWKELRTILDTLQTDVRKDIKAEYTSYGVFQDIYFRDKHEGKEIPDTPHFFLHFIFRFPGGVTIKNINFQDPNPYDQFEFHHKNLVKENELKPNSNFIYRRVPDIINIQELTFEQAQYLKEQLPNHRFIGFTAANGLPLDEVKSDTWIREILAIGYRADRLECLDQGVQWISPTPNQPSIGFDSSRERIIIWAKFRDLATEKEFFMFNAHYDHLGGKKEYVEAEAAIIKSVAKDALWFSFGERFYESFNGPQLYQHYLNTLNCQDVRDKSLFGHYGEAGSWGGFDSDPFAVLLNKGEFEVDTLDVCFTNSKNNHILFSYSLSGAYDPNLKKLYSIDSLIHPGYRLGSDHFMTGFCLILDN